MGEDVFKFLRDIQEEIGKETRSKVGGRIYTWSEHYNNWIDLIQPILRNVSDDEKLNSMVIVRLLELNNQLFWILSNVIYMAAYHQVIRELRFVLDSMLQAYYLDIGHPAANIQCKLEIVKEIEKEAFGGRLIDRLDIPHKEMIKDLYALLSKYTHSSYQELEISIERGKVDFRITPSFDDELFSQCEHLTNMVMDVVYFLTLHRFPHLLPKVGGDEITMKILRDFNSALTLSCLDDFMADKSK